MKEISIFSQINVNNVTNPSSETPEPQRMTSLEIADLTGKQHFHVMEAIRKMEPAWEKIAASKFRLGSYEDANGQRRPCYLLTKTETLYIATKFNDEARARLVIRWEELELAHRGQGRHEALDCPQNDLTPTALPAQKILAMADRIIGEGLRMVNAEAEDTLTATQVAKTFNMTVGDFNAVVRDMGIQYRRFGHWNISDDLAGRGLVSLRTHVSYSLKGEKKVRTYMTWTMAGLRYLNAKLGYPNF